MAIWSLEQLAGLVPFLKGRQNQPVALAALAWEVLGGYCFSSTMCRTLRPWSFENARSMRML